MAQNLITPQVLNQPIANNGDKNTIPNTNDISTGNMSLSVGFPPITSQRIADGGIAPKRADFNGAFNLLSQQHYFFQNGGTETFRQDVSNAIGGYPLNARLWYLNENGESSVLRSTKANNTDNFLTDPSVIGDSWVYDIVTTAYIKNEINEIRDLFVQVGTVIAYAANSAPNGYLICNGAAISRTTYSDLFAKIGTTYGSGDGSSTFNVPNLTDKFIQGSGTAGTSKSAGLPNIIGTFPISANAGSFSGAFSRGSQYSGNGSEGQPNYQVNFNAAYGGGYGIYGTSDTVQPPALTMRYYIKY